MGSAEAPAAPVASDVDAHPGSYSDGKPYPWYAVRVRSNFESTTSNSLQNKGYEVFAPSYRVRRRRKDRSVTLDLPLFAGYIFCRFNHENRLPILKTPGLVHVVGVGGNPMSLSDEEIAAILRLTASGVLVQPWPYMQSGDIVRITSGGLAGLEGILIKSKGQNRLVLSVTLLQRSVATEVEADCVEFIRRGKSPQS